MNKAIKEEQVPDQTINLFKAIKQDNDAQLIDIPEELSQQEAEDLHQHIKVSINPDDLNFMKQKSNIPLNLNGSNTLTMLFTFVMILLMVIISGLLYELGIAKTLNLL